MSETNSGTTTRYRDCPHCKGEGFVTVHVREDSPLLKYLYGGRDVLRACPHCVRRGVVPDVLAGTAMPQPPDSKRRAGGGLASALASDLSP